MEGRFVQTPREAKKRVQKSRSQARQQRQKRHAESRQERNRERENEAKKKGRQEDKLTQRHEHRIKEQLYQARQRTAGLIRALAFKVEDEQLWEEINLETDRKRGASVHDLAINLENLAQEMQQRSAVLATSTDVREDVWRFALIAQAREALDLANKLYLNLRALEPYGG